MHNLVRNDLNTSLFKSLTFYNYVTEKKISLSFKSEKVVQTILTYFGILT